MPDINTQALHITSNEFYKGFQQASLDFELKYKPHVTSFDDIQITVIFIHIAYGNKSDLWKTGYLAGLFAALSGTPYTWTFGPETNDLHYGMSGIAGGIRRAS